MHDSPKLESLQFSSHTVCHIAVRAGPLQHVSISALLTSFRPHVSWLWMSQQCVFGILQARWQAYSGI